MDFADVPLERSHDPFSVATPPEGRDLLEDFQFHCASLGQNSPVPEPVPSSSTYKPRLAYMRAYNALHAQALVTNVPDVPSQNVQG